MNNLKHLIPNQVIRETKYLLAFHHPRPAYPFHVVLIPRRAIAGLVELYPEDSPFLVDLFAEVKRLVHENHLEDQGFRLIANGGGYQEFPWLHFHLTADHFEPPLKFS